MKTDFGSYFDEYVRKNKNNQETIYYTESIEHNENVKKIFSLIEDNHDQVILDAGCGIGNFLILLSKISKQVYGIDISQESINLCEKRIKEEKIENASVQVASLTDIPLPDKSIDKIFCYGVLLYLSNAETEIAIKEFKRILKDDGSVIINFVNGSSPWGITTRLIRAIRQVIKGKKEYSSNYIYYNKLRKIIENQKGQVNLIHSAYFYPVYFPARLIKWIGIRFYFEKYLPEYIKQFGKSITIYFQFEG
ncbi:MAG: class I SAM-dependent methyltransferase [Bacteroidetes bacterium]|nr:MAG: class I SAM-dependent methyltransferase [Bacteroidota bacterium]